jgi:Histidine kinase
LAVGGAVALGLIIAVPMALALLTQPLGFGTDVLGDLRVRPLDSSDTARLTLLGVALLLAVGYAGAGLGALAAVMAPTLLGPSPRERIAALETATGLLTERTRLARELHDSVGHALTVVTVQAAAARRVIDDDPEFARRALGAIEDSGRTAMADLDHVLGLLRDDAHARQAPTRTLTDLPALVAEPEPPASTSMRRSMARSRSSPRPCPRRATASSRRRSRMPSDMPQEHPFWFASTRTTTCWTSR